jgi:hypothetical protein
LRRLIGLAAAAAVAVALVAAPSASSSRFLQHGIFDDAQLLIGDPDRVFPTLAQLNTEIIRVNLWWGGPYGVAQQRPAKATDPADPAYNWAIYDRTVQYAAAFGMHVVFSVLGTPPWANGGLEPSYPPLAARDLRDFTRAAARRYDGTYRGADGRALAAVRRWIAWNEPNNPNFLRPQFRKVGSGWVLESARQYARICNAVVGGVRRVKKNRGKVACGATGPRGNNNPNSSRPSSSPLAFLAGMKKAGAKGFAAYAHHPYYGSRLETPTTLPKAAVAGHKPTAVTLANLDVLTRRVTTLYGKGIRIWVTEYGYQTNPPDALFGVSWARQARFMREAYLRLRRDARVDMFIWFLLRDETRVGGWESGLFTADWRPKTARTTFASLAGLPS